MKNLVLFAAAVTALTISSPATASFVVDTGEPTAGFAWSIGPEAELAGQFTLGAATTITSIEGFMYGRIPGTTGTITIYSNNAVPIAANSLHSATFAINDLPATWQGVFGKSWNLTAGTYWVGFGSSALAGLMSGPPIPLAQYAYEFEGGWLSAPPGFLQIGVRIAGVPSVPEPASWAMMIAGFGLVGGAMRRKKALTMTKVSYA